MLECICFTVYPSETISTRNSLHVYQEFVWDWSVWTGKCVCMCVNLECLPLNWHREYTISFELQISMQMRALSKCVSMRWSCVCQLCIWRSHKREEGWVCMWDRDTCVELLPTLWVQWSTAFLRHYVLISSQEFYERLLGRKFLPTSLC